MKDFTCDIESKLDKIYKEGSQKKYGYTKSASASSFDSELGDERTVKKIATQAQAYLNKNMEVQSLKPALGYQPKKGSLGLIAGKSMKKNADLNI